MLISRRIFLMSGVVGVFVIPARSSLAAEPAIMVTKDPNCGCCTGWAEHLRKEGFAVSVIESSNLNQLKARLGVPSGLASCHTAEISGFVIEGHVPAKAIRRLLAERPQIRGLSVPGMPIGSPGMEVEGQPNQRYEVVAFGASGQQTFAHFEGDKEVSIP